MADHPDRARRTWQMAFLLGFVLLVALAPGCRQRTADAPEPSDLPPGELPLRVTDRELDLSEIKYIIQGKVSPALEKELGAQPFLVPSQTFLLARQLFPELSGELYGLADRKALPNDEFNRITKDIDTWNLRAPSHGPELWKFAGRQEVAQFLEADGDLVYKKIEPHMPDDFGILTLDPSLRPPVLGLTLRQPGLRVAVIENTSPNPVNLGNFLVKENYVAGFRPVGEDAKALKEKASVEKPWFTPVVLRPGEEILVPHAIQFTFPPGTAEEMAEKGKLIVHVYGASVKVDRLTVDGVVYPLGEPEK